MLNAFTVDLEDWFCSHNLRGKIGFADWPSCEPRIVASTERILSLLSQYGVRATFFVLGWVAERAPHLIEKIRDQGHELASHGFSHALITELTPASFSRDIERALEVTRALAGTPVVGFRAPAFTITRRTTWALDVLKSHGIGYDSSVYPFGYHPDYGIPGARLSIYKHENSIVEVPMSCVDLKGVRIPCGGGCYFRLYPYWFFRKLARNCNENGRPLIFCLHPWEIDPHQPVVGVPRARRFRHYTGLGGTLGKLHRLLKDFEFTSIVNLLASEGILQS